MNDILKQRDNSLLVKQKQQQQKKTALRISHSQTQPFHLNSYCLY